MEGIRIKQGSRVYTRFFMTGNEIFKEEKTGLYMADEGKYLSISGNTHLDGVCYLPEIGVRSVSVDGNVYSGSRLVYGSVKTSQDALPSLRDTLSHWMRRVFTKSDDANDSVRGTSDLYQKDSIVQSFSDKTLLYTSAGIIRLSNISLKGNIVIRSDTAVIIEKTLKAQNIIVAAHSVIVEQGFEGCLQILAKDSLLIEKNVTLTYPSMAAVYSYDASSVYAAVCKGAVIDGGVLCYSNASSLKSVRLYLLSGSVVNGIVYCNGETSFSGTIYGSLYAKRFFLKTKRGNYDNHLLNGVVDPTEQYARFVSPFLCKRQSGYGVIQCLN